jgi:hypothetical protein
MQLLETPSMLFKAESDFSDRIFRDRQTILEKMHQFFSQNLGDQKIYLLHGLGGSGKTQIALKFVQQSSSQEFSSCSNIFLVDASTIETIEIGLKALATSRSAGSTAVDALQWLRSAQDEWLLLFDKADDLMQWSYYSRVWATGYTRD